MGICYTVILMDDFDWDYVDTDKVKRTAEFIQKMNDAGAYCEKIAEWYHALVFDLDKSYPLNEKIKKVILSACDTAYYISDQDGCLIQRLE